MEIAICPAGPEEAEAIWQLTRDAFSAHQTVLDPPSGVFRETVGDVLRALVEGTIYVALRDGALIGAARVTVLEDERTLYCGRLAVAPEAQRAGVGTALITRVERQAAAEGYPAVVVGVRTQLPGNLRFFTRLGYHIHAEHSHPGYDRPTYVRLRKDLGPSAGRPSAFRSGATDLGREV